MTVYGGDVEPDVEAHPVSLRVREVSLQWALWRLLSLSQVSHLWNTPFPLYPVQLGSSGGNPMNEPSEPGIHEGITTGATDGPFEARYATLIPVATARLRELSKREGSGTPRKS